MPNLQGGHKASSQMVLKEHCPGAPQSRNDRGHLLQNFSAGALRFDHLDYCVEVPLRSAQSSHGFLVSAVVVRSYFFLRHYFSLDGILPPRISSAV